MRVFRSVGLTFGSLALVALSTVPAWAADATAVPGSSEIAGGYSYVYDSDSSTGVPAGWFFTAGANIGETLAIVADISGNYKSQSVGSGGVTATTSSNVHTFLAGPRVVARSGQISFYGQFLVGAARASGGASGSVGGVSFNSSASDTEFCFAPGAGVDFNLGERTALRAGVSERLIRAASTITIAAPVPPLPTFQKEFQLQIGLVYRFGS